MESRRQICQCCGVRLLVPLDAQAVRCPNCRNTIACQFNGNYFLPDMNIGFSPYNRYWKPTPVLTPSPPCLSKKRAVLCGVNYKNHHKPLKGSINDVLSMRYFLVERLGFPTASVILLTEEEQDPSRIPTKRNMKAALQWLVQGSQAGDSLVFHYSGHGSRVKDQNGDELDGVDEALCPVDFETEGKILDDQINAILVRPLPRGATLHAVIDTCFSGTCLDLPYMCRLSREGSFKWEDHRIPFGTHTGTSGGLAISISACDDHENSGETTAFTGTSTGALTYSFIETLEREPRLTYGRLLMSMRRNIYNAQRGPGLSSNFGSKLSQEPQLSSSGQFDIHRKPFIL